jgi:hypothetical protein
MEVQPLGVRSFISYMYAVGVNIDPNIPNDMKYRMMIAKNTEDDVAEQIINSKYICQILKEEKYPINKVANGINRLYGIKLANLFRQNAANCGSHSFGRRRRSVKSRRSRRSRKSRRSRRSKRSRRSAKSSPDKFAMVRRESTKFISEAWKVIAREKKKGKMVKGFDIKLTPKFYK